MSFINFRARSAPGSDSPLAVASDSTWPAHPSPRTRGCDNDTFGSLICIPMANAIVGPTFVNDARNRKANYGRLLSVIAKKPSGIPESQQSSSAQPTRPQVLLWNRRSSKSRLLSSARSARPLRFVGTVFGIREARRNTPRAIQRPLGRRCHRKKAILHDILAYSSMNDGELMTPMAMPSRNASALASGFL